VVERLWVIRDGQILADLERDDERRVQLRVRAEIVSRADGTPEISLSLPVRAAPYDQPALLPFFDGLLPEGLVRQALATRFRLDSADVFGLLREIGRDCAGALSLVPEGADLDPARPDGVEWLDEAALADRVANLATRPFADAPDEGIRISLAGAQNKMAVVIDEGRIGLPRGATPSTHILKPASVERRSRREQRLKYPALVANEAFCMILARHAGLRVAPVSVRRIDNDPALLVERYDRIISGGQVSRVHQEDFCQALGVLPSRKYEAGGGPALADLLALLRRASVDVLSDQPELLDRIAFNYVIGNEDAHAKNFSLLHGTAGTRLAPAYDLLSTFVYPDLKKEMAVAINGMYDSRALKPIHWKKAFEQLGVSERLYGQRFAALAERVEHAIPQARADLQEWHLGNGTLDQLVALISRRAQALKELRGT